MRETCERQDIKEGWLTVHSDRGSPMKSETLSQFYADLGVTKTHSRPHVSNDNPFSVVRRVDRTRRATLFGGEFFPTHGLSGLRKSERNHSRTHAHGPAA